MKTSSSVPPEENASSVASSGATIERERTNFRQLLAANPNYFGNLAGSELPVVSPIATNPSYERLHCVGYDHEHNLLAATVHLLRSFGYNGNLCSGGSTEFVRFYLDYGSGWEDAGLASFNAHDIPDSTDCAGRTTKPLAYVVTHSPAPKRRCCSTPQLPRVRAVLSWEISPPANTPNWAPVWGDMLERHIQIKPRQWTIGCLFDSIVADLTIKPKLPKLFEELQEVEIPIPDPGPLSFAELAQVYSSSAKPVRPADTTNVAMAKIDPRTLRVEPQRFGLPMLQSVLAAAAPDQLGLSAFAKQWADLGLSWPDGLKFYDQTKADVTYEELTCLGLDYNREWLVATVHLKRPAGYAGSLCQAGSSEHVAFWADWEDTCQWSYLGTVSVNVHDLAPLPEGGLHYAAILPVDLAKVRRGCDQPRISRVRAVLSWSTLPSTTDPDDLHTYGNRVDTHVQVRPGPVITAPIPHIRSLGGIPIEHIDTTGDGMTRMLGAVPAKFWFNDAPADAWGLNRDCPFGGQVLVHGMWFPGHTYRLLVKRESGAPSTATPLLTSFQVTRWTPGFDTQAPVSTDPSHPAYGFFTYLNPLLYLENNLLGVWNTSGDERWEIKLQLATPGFALVGETPWLKLQLDNTPPVAEISISNGGDCKGFAVGDVITGNVIARDAYFGAFSLAVMPNTTTIPSNQPTTAWPATTPTPLSGTSWTLNTGSPISMKPCGYVARVVATSRTIVGSSSGGHHQAVHDTGFYLLAS
jgi:hypothetical protein